MNASPTCHEIPGIPKLFVDAFHGSYLRKTKDLNNTFILTHWHGDHYGSLPKDGRYKGPAKIHCTPQTASLLREMHKIPSELVVEHEYGRAWSYPRDDDSTIARITFYDANHCPGAAIVAAELMDGTVQLHTGDMRYHPKMKEYPVIAEAARNRKLDTVLLDTTYSDPKHTFQPQDSAVDHIASLVHKELGERPCNKTETLVLLSCYNVGKEKVLWESSLRTGQLVCANHRKLRILKCLETKGSQSSGMFTRCTENPDKSDIHVIRMGLAGELWPYFKPNYKKCQKYAASMKKEYRKVVAIIPTGWAEGSAWNKRNSISRSEVNGIEVEIHLVGYSEHSSYSELQDFVAFLRPRKIEPTVFKDESDKHRIEGLFKIDDLRAKQHFFGTNSPTKQCLKRYSRKRPPTDTPDTEKGPKRIIDASPRVETEHNRRVETLIAMGFNSERARLALRESRHNIEDAVQFLLSSTPERTQQLGTATDVIDLT